MRSGVTKKFKTFKRQLSIVSYLRDLSSLTSLRLELNLGSQDCSTLAAAVAAGGGDWTGLGDVGAGDEGLPSPPQQCQEDESMEDTRQEVFGLLARAPGVITKLEKRTRPLKQDSLVFLWLFAFAFLLDNSTIGYKFRTKLSLLLRMLQYLPSKGGPKPKGCFFDESDFFFSSNSLKPGSDLGSTPNNSICFLVRTTSPPSLPVPHSPKIDFRGLKQGKKCRRPPSKALSKLQTKNVSDKYIYKNPRSNTVLIGYSDWPPSRGLRSLQTVRGRYLCSDRGPRFMGLRSLQAARPLYTRLL